MAEPRLELASLHSETWAPGGIPPLLRPLQGSGDFEQVLGVRIMSFVFTAGRINRFHPHASCSTLAGYWNHLGTTTAQWSRCLVLLRLLSRVWLQGYTVVDRLHQDPQGAGEEADSQVLSAPPWSKHLVPRARLPICSQFPQVMWMLNQCSGYGQSSPWSPLPSSSPLCRCFFWGAKSGEAGTFEFQGYKLLLMFPPLLQKGKRFRI